MAKIKMLFITCLRVTGISQPYNVFICSCHPWLPSWKKQAKGVNLLIKLHMFTHCRLLRNS